MAKKVKRRAPKYQEDEVMVGDDVRESIVAIGLIAVGAILLLAFFGMAGQVGRTVDGFLAANVGLARIAVPLLFFAIGATVVIGDRRFLTWRNMLALGIFVVAFCGLMNLLFASGVTDVAVVSAFGGRLGLLVSSLLVASMGFIAALILAGACFLVSVIVLLNTSLRTLLAPAFALFGMMRRKEDEEAVEDGETFEERQAREEEEPSAASDSADASDSSPEEEDSAPAAPYVPPAEQVMTSKLRRKIDIPFDLLDDRSSDAKAGDIERNKEIIVKTFSQFNIPVEMSEVKVGPTVSQYALRPAQGVKLARIVALQNDLALALAAHPIRIEAPIPGKSLVGIEVPNQTIGRVCLRELLESKEFQHRKTSFTAPIGKDISGGTQLLSVDKAPHMLVAGATGSGKSVCLNTIIISLLYQNGPDDLKLIMVDPKRVELGVYGGIPHLLVPPITKADEAINALKWAVREMERRLDYLAKFGARDIDSYNQKAKERMPRIIVIIDELADLMSQNKRDVEAVIVRIAQMARAAGIHLVLATQRPSVDVITGTIKANIPTRLAFAVASQVDSKTILDISGAEKLLGRGDMLMSTPEISKPRRLQGAYLSEKEIERVVDFLKGESAPDYNYQITEGASSGGVSMNPEDSDDLMEDAIQIVLESGKASTSFLQRRMKIGYSRAARIIDLMEQMGIIGAQDGAKPREILVTEWPPEGSRKPTQFNTRPPEDDDELDEEEAMDEDEEDADLPDDEDEAARFDEEEDVETEEDLKAKG
ncbi:DNA translocase FtsK 4TM domain-containing protein [Candidatus Uhrbacteria bacterium]|nr:DNA translocase FtsK 4TM domain-containing protein [Candidatus Uhrbacteria bacterium]